MLFSCYDVAGTPYLYDQMNIQCYSSHHRWWQLVVGVPGVITYVFAIPLCIFFLLWKDRVTITDLEHEDHEEVVWHNHLRPEPNS